MAEMVSGVITYISLDRKFKRSPVPSTQGPVTPVLGLRNWEDFLRHQPMMNFSSIFRKRWYRDKTRCPG